MQLLTNAEEGNTISNKIWRSLDEKIKKSVIKQEKWNDNNKL